MGTRLQTARDMRSRSFARLRSYQKAASNAALTALDTSTYADGKPVRVDSEVWLWSADATDTPDGLTVLQPDAGGDGRWLLEQSIDATVGGLPTTALPPLTTLPTSPATGTSVSLSGEPLAWNGDRWVGFDGNTYSVTGSASIREVVTAGAPHDPSSHTWVDGVVVLVDGSTLIVRRKGIVEGFTGLTPGQLYLAGPSGTIQASSGSLSQWTIVGRAVTTTALYVDVERPIGV